MHTATMTSRFATLLALSTALAGCGGGAGDKAPPPVPPGPPPTPLSVNFVQPSNNVLEPNASVALSANVVVNGLTAPNGTVATFFVNPSAAGTLAPVAPTTVAGVASTTLTVSALPPAATFQVMASVSSGVTTAADNLTYYVRPARSALQVLVPAYFTATGTTSPWLALTTGAASYPGVKINAVINPNGGILTAATKEDTDLTTAMKNFKAVAGTDNRLLGYVATASSSGAVSVADIKATIDNYIRLYPAQLDGFFLDGMATDSSRLTYFQEIYTYVKGVTTGMSRTASPPAAPLLVGNPGTYPVAAYAGVADTLVTYAGNAAAYQGVDPQPASTWVYAKSNSAQAVLVHSASTCTDMQAAVKKADRPRLNTGMVYVTNLAIGAPWSALPTYWQQLLGTVDALNKDRAVPLC